MTLRELADSPVPWLSGEGPRSDLVLSSRVRLARNLAGRAFPHRASATQAEEVLREVTAVAGEAWNLEDLSGWERQVLLERHLASPRLVSGVGARGVIAAEDDAAHVMVNEEDHLRIQSVAPGFQLSTALVGAVETERRLDGKLEFAASPRHGYLTACPTNVGTGLRASVLLHLPGLVLSGEIKRMHAAVSEMGMVARGWFGEGSRVVGDFHQLSNQRTLGLTEEEAVEELERVALRVLELELDARSRLVSDRSRRRQLEDRVHRSRATLGHARLLTVEQAMACVSDIRMGKWLGRFQDVSEAALNRLTVLAQPAHLARDTERLPEREEASWRRARLARCWFGQGAEGPEDEGAA